MGECFFWYRLIWIVSNKCHKRIVVIFKTYIITLPDFSMANFDKMVKMQYRGKTHAVKIPNTLKHTFSSCYQPM